MDNHKLVPGVFDTIPKNVIKIEYPSGVSVNTGNELTPLSVKDEPIVEWPTEEDAYYTLAMIGPDSGQKAEIKFWLVVNIPGDDVSKGETLASYWGPAPPAEGQPHRYVFVVYKQPGHLKHSETPLSKDSREGRVCFKVKQFAKKYNLGEPYAFNLYLAKGDNHSAQVRVQLGLPK